MDELDFTKPQPAAPSAAAPPPIKSSASPYYDRDIAARLFRASGRAERFAAGTTLFAEDQKATGGGFFFSRSAASRMYYLAEGQVSLSAGGRTLDTAGAGEVIGEMAVITERPRSATAVARTDCSGWSMDAEEFKGALRHMPEFAIMVMSVIFERLRFVTARLAARRTAIAARPDEPPVFEAALLERLEAALPRSATARYAPGSVIMREGQAGAYMYVVKSGQVAISVREHVVAVVSPGGTFGEMALVDQSPRSATATAQAECVLLSIDRKALIEAVKAQPAFAIAMLGAYAERLRHMNAQVA